MTKKNKNENISEEEFKKTAARCGLNQEEIENILAEFFPDQEDVFVLEELIASLAARV